MSRERCVQASTSSATTHQTHCAGADAEWRGGLMTSPLQCLIARRNHDAAVARRLNGRRAFADYSVSLAEWRGGSRCRGCDESPTAIGTTAQASMAIIAIGPASLHRHYRRTSRKRATASVSGHQSRIFAVQASPRGQSNLPVA